MPNDPIDPLKGPKYVLEGRIVTMSDDASVPDVVPEGAIYIEKGEIKAVQDASLPAAAGFESARRIRTGDTIYPGLMELHNHLCYNAMPLWEVPQAFLNNSSWRNHDDYPRLITKPSQVLGRTDGIAEALVRFTECKCLLGGVTTSQGITLANAGGIKEYYRGIVRNVEQTDDPDLPEAGTRIANPDTGKAQNYLETLEKFQGRCYLQHLSEGVNETARGWFLRLRIDSDEWALTPAFCGIHSTALRVEDFKIIASKGGSMVWSPLSNYLLYGDTVDIKAVKEAGILMGIGSDWAPSGSKNLLGELKVAWLTSQQRGLGDGQPVFTPREIVAMATCNAAKILKWTKLGSIRPGNRADLVAINGQRGDDYLRVLEARETSITLVVINGVPRVGQKRLMKPFASATDEEIKVGDSKRVLNLEQETSHPLVGNLTLTEATQRLEDAMHNLPALARAVDQADSTGMFGGSLDAAGVQWRVECDFEEEDRQLALAAEPYAFFVTSPMEIESITVAGDSDFLRKLVRARNLPKFIKQGLPGLYGEEIPIPPSASFLLKTETRVPDELRWSTQDLKTFLQAQTDRLTLEDRRTIVNQALVLLEENYVHLPFKRAMHAVDPVQRLKLLRNRLGEITEIEFHNELAATFNSLRDLHTRYTLPYPYKWLTAWLPFFVEAYWDEEADRWRYIVTKIVGNPGPADFEAGVEILYWNGTPIEKAVAQNADRQPGSNPSARRGRGLNSLTIRPLGFGPFPEEEWVTLRYCTLDGEIREWTQEWLVFEPGVDDPGVDPESLRSPAAMVLGLDPQTNEVQEAKRVFFAGDVLDRMSRAAAGGWPQPAAGEAGELLTQLPTVFRAETIPVQNRDYGYLRIFTFNVADPDGFVNEFVRLVEGLPENGLIIDVRGNGGGHIHAAERILQVLTPHRIEPERAQFINTPLNLRISREESTLEPWTESIELSVRTAATYSLGYPITPEKLCNDIGQRYYGPVVLITDALCYSATDMFAAGFQDHGIGKILGVDANTGAGGANVWSHALLRGLTSSEDDPSLPAAPYVALPRGTDLRVAMRRTLRTRSRAGTAVEDLGIEPDEEHKMKEEDLLQGNTKLIARAAEILARSEPHPIRVKFEPRSGALPLAHVETRNMTWLDVSFDDRPRGTHKLKRNQDFTTLDLQPFAEDLTGATGVLELRGWDGDELVAFRREEIAA